MTTTHTNTLPLAPGRWAVDTNHSSIGFTIRHLGVSKVRGRFARFEADVVILEDYGKGVLGAEVIQAALAGAKSRGA